MTLIESVHCSVNSVQHLEKENIKRSKSQINDTGHDYVDIDIKFTIFQTKFKKKTNLNIKSIKFSSLKRTIYTSKCIALKL